MDKNQKGTAMVPTPLEERPIWAPDNESGLISMPTGEKPVNIEQELKALERDIEIFKKIQVLSLRLTKPKDWVLQVREGESEGTPYPMERGLENIRLAFGIDVSGREMRREWAEDPQGRYYT